MRIAILIAVLLCFGQVASGQEPTEADPQPGDPPRSSHSSGEPERQAAPTDPDVTDGGDLAAPTHDERSVVLLRQSCETRSHNREVTLFANGTVRVRQSLDEATGAVGQGSFGGPDMALGELAPDELAAWVDSIRDEDLGQSDRHSAGPVGDMVPRCRLLLDYDAMARWVGPAPATERPRGDGRPEGRRVIEYGGFDTFGLELARVLERIDSLAARVDPAAGRRTLPPRYEPAVGDVLRRADGMLFRVERSTASPGGWELQGVDQPLTLYVMEDRFPRLFTELVGRR